MTPSSLLLVDAHVHYHTCFEKRIFFDSAEHNFESGARESGVRCLAGVLLFTETAQDHVFRAFRAECGTRQDGWIFSPTADDNAIVASSPQGLRLILVAGRQITTREGLEVLALGSDEEFPEGLEFGHAVETVESSGAIPVVPWGFGKWWLQRGRLVADLLNQRSGNRVFLGDNAGRARFAPRPKMFDLATSRGIKILPGTDPLPFAGQATKAGRYGFLLEDELDWDRPAKWLMHRIRGLCGQPRVYGQLEGVADFCRYQLAIQLRKRGGLSVR